MFLFFWDVFSPRFSGFFFSEFSLKWLSSWISEICSRVVSAECASRTKASWPGRTGGQRGTGPQGQADRASACSPSQPQRPPKCDRVGLKTGQLPRRGVRNHGLSSPGLLEKPIKLNPPRATTCISFKFSSTAIKISCSTIMCDGAQFHGP